MKTSDDTWKIDAFVDGELDLAGQLEMEARLRDDPVLRQQVDDVRALSGLVREKADRPTAPDALRARLAASLAPAASAVAAPPLAGPGFTPARPASSPRPSIVELLGRALSWRPLAVSMSFAVLLAVGANLLWLQASDEQKLGDEIVAGHVRSTLGQHLVDVASSDHHTVKPFLSARLGFSPPVDELQIPGSSFVGGRVDYVGGRPVAALVYRQGEHIVNSFVWPSSGADARPRYATERGFQTAHWSASGMTHWVISDVNREEFQAIVAAVQKNDAAR